MKGGTNMKKDEFVKLGVDEETAKKLETASQEELKGYIPKARFDEVNNEKKKLELDVRDRDSQLETLKNSTGDVEVMKQQIADLQKANKDAADAHAAEVKQLKIDSAVLTALTGAKAKNNAAVKALLKDLDKAEFAEDGTIKGLAEQIEVLKPHIENIEELVESDDVQAVLDAIDDVIVDNILANNDEPDDEGIKLQKIYDEIFNENL